MVDTKGMRIGVTVFLTDQGIDPATLGAAVEDRGFASLYFPEHTHLPVRDAEPPSLVSGVTLENYRRSLDPMIGLAAAAVVTSEITLGTGVLLVAQHDPIALAKQIATLDHLCDGRLTMGIGYGWNRAEAADHGVDFAQRRQLVTEKLALMQALWSREEAAYKGELVELAPSYAWPKPVQQPRVKTLLGGGAGPKLFAAIVESCDGWMPIGGSGLGDALPRLRQQWRNVGRSEEALSVVPFGVIPDEGKLAHFRVLGCDEVVLRVPMGSTTDVISALDSYVGYLR